MKKCPNCQAEVKADERFCGSCGARLEPSLPPETNTPPQRTGRETVVLSLPSDFGATPPPPQPSTDATLIAGPAAQPQSPNDATLIGVPGVQPAQPSASPAGGAYTGTSPQPTPFMPAPAAQSGGNIWKIIGIIAGIGVLACVLLAAGVYFFIVQPAGRALNNGLSTAQAGLPVGLAATISAGMETAVTLPTFVPNTNGDADATAEPNTNGDNEAVLYSEDFDTPNKKDFDEDTTDNSSYKFVDGAYAITTKTANWLSWEPIKGDYGDASIAVDTTLKGAKKSGAALLFHYQDNKNFYLYTVAGDGSYSLDVYKDDKPKTLVEWTDSPEINGPGKTNTLRVETVGDTIRLFVNDKLLDEVSDSTFTKGKAAIAVNTFDDANITVTFDNLIIRAVK